MLPWPPWKVVIARWRVKYPYSNFEKGKYDPTSVRVSPRRCAKCGSKHKVHRHHKGHEYYLAIIAEDWYARRYIQFHPADWVALCDGCHETIHVLYEPIMLELRLYVESIVDKIEDGKFVFKHPPNFEVLQSFRRRFIAKCDHWLKNQLPRKRRRRRRLRRRF